MNWQPIETLPLGTKRAILALQYDGQWEVWLGSPYEAIVCLKWVTPGKPASCQMPTHWMPAPDAPDVENVEPKPTLEKWPERIYLQRHDDCVQDDCGPHGDDTTWCRDQINEHDVPYVRADIVLELEQRIRNLQAEVYE